MGGEVGLLTRNIVVEGNTYENFAEDSFGGRIVVSKLTQDGVEYVGESVKLKDWRRRTVLDILYYYVPKLVEKEHHIG